MGRCWWICYGKPLCNSTKPLVCDVSDPNGLEPASDYEDLYFTEQPYGLVCGVETDLPANDSSSAAFT